jgi:hypothetical protein
MATLVAIRHTPTLRIFYDRLVAAGKAKKLALTAAMASSWSSSTSGTARHGAHRNQLDLPRQSLTPSGVLKQSPRADPCRGTDGADYKAHRLVGLCPSHPHHRICRSDSARFAITDTRRMPSAGTPRRVGLSLKGQKDRPLAPDTPFGGDRCSADPFCMAHLIAFEISQVWAGTCKHGLPSPYPHVTAREH